MPKQTPAAVILGCADSRVPPELVFDQGLGDLFVVRVAGNVVTPAQMGSIEFAVDSLGCRLVVVLEGLIRSDGLVVIGAEYALETGEVDFFDGVDELE